VRDNEQTFRVLIVHFSKQEGEKGREERKGERDAEKKLQGGRESDRQDLTQDNGKCIGIMGSKF
jgi:hypothetical protein